MSEQIEKVKAWMLSWPSKSDVVSAYQSATTRVTETGGWLGEAWSELPEAVQQEHEATDAKRSELSNEHFPLLVEAMCKWLEKLFSVDEMGVEIQHIVNKHALVKEITAGNKYWNVLMKLDETRYLVLLHDTREGDEVDPIAEKPMKAHHAYGRFAYTTDAIYWMCATLKAHKRSAGDVLRVEFDRDPNQVDYVDTQAIIDKDKVPGAQRENVGLKKARAAKSEYNAATLDKFEVEEIGADRYLFAEMTLEGPQSEALKKMLLADESKFLLTMSGRQVISYKGPSRLTDVDLYIFYSKDEHWMFTRSLQAQATW